jgi:uncharacterized protein (TIGR00725 family)
MDIIWKAKDCIAVLGSATCYTKEQIIAAFQIGREIANQNKNLITGGTTGIPYAAAIGAKLDGGTVIGNSPAANAEEHVLRYKKPLDYTDIMIYTGLGFEGRNPINVRSAKGAIFIGGEFGTLNEFSAAYTIGNNVLGILEGVGGFYTCIWDMLANAQSSYGSTVIFESDPILLARRVCAEVDQKYPNQTAKQLQRDEIGSDVRKIIHQFLDEENQYSCVMRSANIPIGVS